MLPYIIPTLSHEKSKRRLIGSDQADAEHKIICAEEHGGEAPETRGQARESRGLPIAPYGYGWGSYGKVASTASLAAFVLGTRTPTAPWGGYADPSHSASHHDG
ncbi:MAG TPA: hypothetical protein VJG64_00320 [Candidatus Paceibacterota bacterium]